MQVKENRAAMFISYEQKKVLRETNGQRKVWLVLMVLQKVGQASCSLRMSQAGHMLNHIHITCMSHDQIPHFPSPFHSQTIFLSELQACSILR